MAVVIFVAYLYLLGDIKLCKCKKVYKNIVVENELFSIIVLRMIRRRSFGESNGSVEN